MLIAYACLVRMCKSENMFIHEHLSDWHFFIRFCPLWIFIKNPGLVIEENLKDRVTKQRSYM